MSPAITISMTRVDQFSDTMLELGTVTIGVYGGEPFVGYHAAAIKDEEAFQRQHASRSIERTPVYVAAEQALLALEREIRVAFDAPFTFED